MADKIALVRLRALNDAFDKAYDRSREKVKGLGKSIGDLDGNASKLEKVGASFEATFGTSMARAGDKLTKGVTLPLAAVATGAVFAAVSWETAWAGVTKTVDGTSEQLSQLESDLRDMAKELPASHKEIAAVAEAAGQLGVAVEDVAEFTRTMIDLGETTNLTAQEAATSLARFSNIMGTSSEDVERLGSTIVELGNNSATTEAEILEMATRLAAAGKIAGLSEADVFAFASALTSVGVEAEAGGTALSRVFTAVRDAVIDGGDQLETFARVSGLSAKQFADAFRSDPADAIRMFIEGMGRLSSSGKSTTAVFEELELTDQRLMRAILSTGEAQGLLGDQIGMARGAWQDNNALQTEAEKRYATTASQLRMLRNQLVDLGIDVGEKLLPALSKGMDAVGALVAAFDALPGAVQYAVIAFGGLAMAVGPVLKVGGLLVDNFRTIVDVMRKVSGATGTTAVDIGKIGVASIAAGFAVQALVEELASLDDGQERLDAHSQDVLKVMRETGDVFAGTTKWVEQHIEAQSELGSMFELTGKSAYEIAAALMYGDQAWMDLATSTKAGTQAFAVGGEETQRLSSAVRGAWDDFGELGTAVKGAGDDTQDAAVKFSAAEQALLDVAVAAMEARAAHQGLFQSMFGSRVISGDLDEAFGKFNDTLRGTESSGGRAGKSIDLVAKKQEELDRATADAERALESWQSATENVTDAQDGLIDAQERLREALAGPSGDERADAEDDVTNARLSLESATHAVEDAEQRLQDAQADGDQREIARADLNLRQARQRLKEQTDSVTDAEKAYNDILGWTAETSPEVAEATDAVTEAQKRLDKATKEASDRYRDLEAAQIAQNDIANRALSTFDDSSGRIGSHSGSVRDAAGAYLELARAVDTAISSILGSDIANTEMLDQINGVISQIENAPGLTPEQREELLRFAYAKKATIQGAYGKTVGGGAGSAEKKARGIFGMAEGGMGTAYGPTHFLAAEAGEPEDYLFAPHSKGGIPGVLSRAGVGGGGAYTYAPQITVVMPPGSNGADVVRSVSRYERRNGSGWRNN